MAFNINPGKQQFSATAAQTVFTFNFAIFADTDLKVYKTLAGAVADDTADILILSTHYTVSINGTLGGTVTLLSGASLNDTITVVRSLPITRTTDYVTNGDLYADTLDLDQDYQTYLTADADVQLQRAIIVPESLSGVSLSIPAPVANSYLRWNATADALENDTTIPAAVVTTNANVVLTNADVILTHADVVLTHADVVLANKWAEEAENVEVTTGEYSSHHWAIKAAVSAASLVVDAVPTDASTNAVSSNGVFDALAGKQSTLTFDAVPTNGSTNPVESNGIFDAIAAIQSSPSGVRQTVQSGSVDTSGFANFVSIGTGLNVNIAATTTPIKIHAAGGAISSDRLGTISADKTLLLPASSTSYIYESVATDGTCTSGSTTLAPIYQFGGTPSIVAGQHTYNISEGKMYVGVDGVVPAVQVWNTFHSEAVTNGTNVTSVVTYALNGMYDSGYTATLPALASYTSKNHNIGTEFVRGEMLSKCTTIDAGYAVGQICTLVANTTNIGMNNPVDRLTIGTQAGAAGSGWALITKSIGTVANITATSWSYKLIARRSF